MFAIAALRTAATRSEKDNIHYCSRTNQLEVGNEPEKATGAPACMTGEGIALKRGINCVNYTTQGEDFGKLENNFREQWMVIWRREWAENGIVPAPRKEETEVFVKVESQRQHQQTNTSNIL